MKKKAIQFKDITKPFSPWQYWILTILFPLFFMYLSWASAFHDGRTFLKAFSWYSIVGITQSLGHGYIGLQLNRWFPWKERPKTRLLLTIVALVVYSVIAYVLVATLLALFWNDISLKEALDIGLQGVWVAVKISFAFAFVFASISFFLNWQNSVVKAERLEKELANYRYQTLKEQVNPHFLFNSLNVLTDLVHEDADLAEKYIQQLSRIYRYVLDSSNQSMVPLAQELEFVHSYIFLLKIRFGQKLKISLDLNANTHQYIVPVSIQMLIENAVKHNQITTENPLEIKVFERAGHIVVRNNYRPKRNVKDVSGKGLNNLQQQFRLWTDEPIDITQSETSFTVSLPIIEDPNLKL